MRFPHHEMDIDNAYEQVAAFDEQQRRAWLEKVTVVFCKRTDYPKLGYLVHRLNEAGVPSVLHGESFHAPILRVHKDYEEQAWAILAERAGKRTLDDVPDDDKRFERYGNTQPDTDLWED